MESELWPFIVSSLHTYLQALNFQRCKLVFHPIGREWNCILPCFLLPVHSIPAPEASYCTTILFKVLYCKIKKVFFIFVFIFYVLCEKYYYRTVYTAYCVSWVPRLTLLDLWTNWTYKHTLRMDRRHTLLSYCRQPEDLPNISETHSTYCTCALNNS